MQTRKMDTRYMVLLAMFIAMLLVLQTTGIGIISLPIVNITTLHVPVILGAIVLGPKAGGILGGVFGLCSIWANITKPTLLSFAFSPVLAGEMAGTYGVICSIWIVLGCRILLGVLAGWLWVWLKKWKWNDLLALPVTAIAATAVHSVLVMTSIGTLFATEYATQKSVAIDSVFGLCMGTVATNGTAETIFACILVTAIGKALLSLNKKRR